ncbi:hypothetical protein JGS22_016630 [Streptomyces sp. P38-E01]|uniref:DUF2273 domain-containing protein n=1 Tax=Streptomyces tardus TaxID=2780544 RepID=A0A949JFR0_9ACTN|nr:hypothetical protein [Streptomyces tardus]MBU7599192.1 hypothetical protein [Streptomyces tardus]
MNKASTGLMTGMALGFAGWFGGFVAFLLVGALGALGWLVGRALDDGASPLDLLRGPGRRDQ